MLVATLTPAGDPRGLAAETPLLCLVCGVNGGADVAVNLLLFLPLSVGLRLAGVSWARIVVIAGLLSLTVELLQLFVIPGRDASLSDVLTNTISGALGATLGTLLPGLLRPRPARALALLAGGGIALVLTLLVSGWLLSPEVPRGDLMSRWAHEAPGTDVFNGRVRSVRLEGVPMPHDGSPPDSAALRQRLDGGRFSLEAEVVSGAPTRDRLWVYMFRVPSGGALTLNQQGRQAGVALPARALRFYLRPPMVTLAAGFPQAADVPVALTAWAAAGRVRIASVYDGLERSTTLGLSPVFGWILFVPFELAVGTGVRWVSGMFLAAMFLPLGYWAAWTRRPRWALLVLAVALGVALGAVPPAVGLPAVHWSEWLAGLLGTAAGWALQRPAAYLPGRCASPSDSESFSS
ncbi:MAG: VanZ family protein [Gemmatimonadales bacterium]